MQPSTNGTYFNLCDYRFRSQREPSLKYPLLQSLYSESGGIHEGLPFYYKKGGKNKDKKRMQKLVEMNDYEIIKISDMYFKFELIIA